MAVVSALLSGPAAAAVTAVSSVDESGGTQCGLNILTLQLGKSFRISSKDFISFIGSTVDEFINAHSVFNFCARLETFYLLIKC